MGSFFVCLFLSNYKEFYNSYIDAIHKSMKNREVKKGPFQIEIAGKTLDKIKSRQQFHLWWKSLEIKLTE